ncbi:MAG: FKBP-type peptidyl-prolyl cis-trans isomerase [Xanthomonadaceae bacterium]|jgi:FKBP-type peptidyl-prolyl cis-trans isomerase|nr:FKBP-type peptidyl-prolyl cis-trans isomerase [Xanthomonadaceae bacterium]
MKFRWMMSALLLAGAGSALAQGGTPATATAGGAAPAVDRNKVSYAIGYEIGRDFVEKKMDVDLQTVIRAIQDGYAKRNPAVPEEQMREAMGVMREKMLAEARTRFEALARENKAKSDKFLAENRSKKGIVALPSGIQYRVIEDGTGKRATPTAEVTVHYRGSLSSGLEFDSSFARGQPASFKVDSVIEGWKEILPMMKVGDHWQVFLPPEKAYGVRGQGPIGPNEALVFDIKLVDVK